MQLECSQRVSQHPEKRGKTLQKITRHRVATPRLYIRRYDPYQSLIANDENNVRVVFQTVGHFKGDCPLFSGSGGGISPSERCCHNK